MANPPSLAICLIINVLFSLSQRANLSTGSLQRSWKLLSQEISFLDDVDAELEAVLMGAGIGYLLYERIKGTLILVV